MSSKSGIEWCEATWNPVRGCSLVSPGCTHCYAMRQAVRIKSYEGLTKPSKAGPVWTGEVRTAPEMLDRPLRWRKPRLIFVNSMSDLFHESIPFEYIAAVFGVMAACPQHTFQVLTKRPERAVEWFEWIGEPFAQASPQWRCFYSLGNAHPKPIAVEAPLDGSLWPLPNVWLGTSVEDQPRADERVLQLLRCPAAVRFLSCEPLLAPVSFRWAEWSPRAAELVENHLDGLRALDWVIVGGESGHRARPMDPQWARSIRDQCEEAGVPYFFKQWGEWAPLDCRPGEWPRRGPRFTFSGGQDMIRAGKKAAGRELDGRTWDQMPEVAQ